MWKQLIAPTLIVAVLWLVVSPLTTYFIYWLDQSYQQSLTRNLAVIRAIDVVTERVWRLLSYAGESSAEPLSDQQGRRVAESIGDVETALQVLRSQFVLPEDQAYADRITTQWKDLLATIGVGGKTQPLEPSASRWQKTLQTAEAMSLTADQIRAINVTHWEAADEHRSRWRGIIYTTRFVLVVVGPAVGLALGFWISRRIHRSISQINIILKDATLEWEQNLAKLHVSGGEDLRDLRDRVEGVVRRMREVSAELESARRETLRSERLAAVGELAAGVAHELRNPLTSVKLLLQHAAQQPGGAKLTKDESQVVLDEILRMETTIEGLLDLSRPPSVQRERHDLRDTVRRALNLVQGRARQQHAHFETCVPDSPVFVFGDSDQLHQVFVNLLINGLEADPGGTLRIEMVAEDERVRVQIRDFGPGIPEHVLKRLFEPFESTKERGTGLGLAISRRIARHHGGSLTADNHPDGGAVLTLDLPLSAEAEGPAASPSAPSHTIVTSSP